MQISLESAYADLPTLSGTVGNGEQGQLQVVVVALAAVHHVKLAVVGHAVGAAAVYP